MYTHVLLTKAFDTVKPEPLIYMLQNLDINDKDTCLLTTIYLNQQADERCNGDIGKCMNIK